ncbi:MAG: RNA-directed DNA polymerase [Candidatus Falkowbacteria bacterium]
MPIGNLTSQIFANIFLDKFDWFIKKQLRINYYFRYADDFVIINPDPEYLKHLVKLIESFLNTKLNLKLHPKKVEIRKFEQGIDFLGYVVLPRHIVLRTKTKKRMFKKMKIRINEYNNKIITEEQLNQSLQSYLGVLSHANCYKLSKELKNLTQPFS